MTLHRANVWSAATAVDPMVLYEPGGANLDPAVSTADFYGMTGLYWFCPQLDLMACGATGIALAATHGRYLWATGPDHPTGQRLTWRDGNNFLVGFSNDPGSPPEKMKSVIQFDNRNSGIHPTLPAVVWEAYEYAYVYYNPDDAASKPFYMTMEGRATSGSTIQHCTVTFRSADLLTWEAYRTPLVATNSLGWASFAGKIRRNGVGDWIAVALGDPTDFGDYSKYTSTDGIDFTYIGQLKSYVHNSTGGATYTFDEMPAGQQTTICYFGRSRCDDVMISGQRYQLAAEQVGSATTAAFTGSVNKPNYITLVPVDTDGNLLSTPAKIRIEGPYSGVYGGAGWLQAVNGFQEDGILHIWTSRGLPSDVAHLDYGYPFVSRRSDGVPAANGVAVTFTFTAANPPIRPFTVSAQARFSGTDELFHDNGAGVFVGTRISASSINYATGALSVTFTTAPGAGPMWFRYVADAATAPTASGWRVDQCGAIGEQWCDYLTYVTDATAAIQAAPCGVQASCDAGTVTITWYNPQAATRRIYRGIDEDTQTDLLGSTSSTSWTDTPGTGRFWYRVVTLDSSTEYGERIVHCYASSASELANRHICRVLDDDGDIDTINVVWLEAAIGFLTDQDWIRDLLHWASLAFGYKTDSGHITKVYCLGTTRMPRGGDLTFNTSTTTLGTLTDARPAFVNGNTNSFAYFGGIGKDARYNLIRRKRELTMAAVYERTQTSADITFFGQNISNGSVRNEYNQTEQPGLSFSHNAGTPGSVEFKLMDDTFGTAVDQKVATVAGAGGTLQVAIASYDGADMVAYSNGSGGTAEPDYDPNPVFLRNTALAGARGGRTSVPMLGVGSRNCSVTYPTGPTSYTEPTKVFPANEAQFKASDLIVLGRGLDGTEAGDLTTFLQTFEEEVVMVAPLQLRLKA